MSRLVSILLLLVAFCLGAALSYYNWQPVTFHYLAGEAEVPLIALLLLAFLLGLAVMGLLGLARTFVLARDNRRQSLQLRELDTELKNLRSLPLADAGAAPKSNAR